MENGSGGAQFTPHGMDAQTAKITVMIVEDHAVVRQGLKAGLEMPGDIVVIGEADHGRQAVRKIVELKPRVVLLDLAMPIMNGIETAQRLEEILPECKVIVWSSYCEPYEILRGFEAGAVGYVSKDGTISEVADAVRVVAQGNAYLSAPLARPLLALMRREMNMAEHLGPELAELTEREGQLLKLLGDGKTNEQIAAELGISPKTAEKHRGTLMQKLEIRERATLTRYAAAAGVIPIRRPALGDDSTPPDKPEPKGAPPASDENLPEPTRTPTREELRAILRKSREQSKALHGEMNTLRLKVDQLLAEGKDLKKQDPFKPGHGARTEE